MQVVEGYSNSPDLNYLIGLGHFLIKITGTDNSGSTVKKVVKIEYPMGC